MTNIRNYLTQVRQAIEATPNLNVERYFEQIFTDTRCNLRIRLRFADNSLLEISEAVTFTVGTLNWLSYRYHYQTASGVFIFRYDNAPHHPELRTYPDHKHTAGDVVDSTHPTEVKEFYSTGKQNIRIKPYLNGAK
ncbi:hypothetical protein H8E77_05890 [bacterium]|nr:hypothetical protein [bacterium]